LFPVARATGWNTDDSSATVQGFGADGRGIRGLLGNPFGLSSYDADQSADDLPNLQTALNRVLPHSGAAHRERTLIYLPPRSGPTLFTLTAFEE
jgi:hypothetical protein